MSEFANRGALFKNKYKQEGDNRPTLTGNLELGADLVKYLHDKISNNQDAKVDLSVWKRTNSNGTNFFSMSAQVPYADRGGSSREEEDIPF